MLVGFMGRVEQELGRVLMEDAWRSASHQERWRFTAGLRKSRAKSRQLIVAMLAKIQAGENPTAEEWREVLACADEATRTVLSALMAVKGEEATED